MVETQEQYRRMAKLIGSRASYVEQLLIGRALFNIMSDKDFYGIKNLNDATIEFSLLTTALGYSNIQSFLGIANEHDPDHFKPNNAHLRELTEWIYQKNEQGKTRLGESRNLKDLNRIVAHDNAEALTSFRNGSPLREAVKLTEAADVVFRASVFDAQAKLKTAREYIHRIPQLNSGDDKSLEDIQLLVRDLRTIVRNSLASPDQDV